jgi:hypothetical protein
LPGNGALPRNPGHRTPEPKVTGSTPVGHTRKTPGKPGVFHFCCCTSYGRRTKSRTKPISLPPGSSFGTYSAESIRHAPGGKCRSALPATGAYLIRCSSVQRWPFETVMPGSPVDGPNPDYRPEHHPGVPWPERRTGAWIRWVGHEVGPITQYSGTISASREAISTANKPPAGTYLWQGRRDVVVQPNQTRCLRIRLLAFMAPVLRPS